MKEKDFQGLLESVREAKQILRGGTNATRTFTVEVASPSSAETGFAICLQTRPADTHAPDHTRRPYWLLRPLKPAREFFRLPEEEELVGAD